MVGLLDKCREWLRAGRRSSRQPAGVQLHLEALESREVLNASRVFLPVMETRQRRAVRSHRDLQTVLGFLQESLSDRQLELTCRLKADSCYRSAL